MSPASALAPPHAGLAGTSTGIGPMLDLRPPDAGRVLIHGEASRAALVEGVSPLTVGACQGLHAPTRAEAVRRAKERGWLGTPRRPRRAPIPRSPMMRP